MAKISPRVVLIGHPNVGKSLLFNILTGHQVSVSNYPGTTVELVQGYGLINGVKPVIIDSPGLYSLNALSEEEQVTRLLLIKKKPDLVIQLADACNLPRMLVLTLELMEADLPLMLVVNMMDEAKRAGIRIDCNRLAARLGIPVIPAALINREGVDRIISAMASLLKGEIKSKPQCRPPAYSANLESGLKQVEHILKRNYGISKRSVALSLLNSDARLDKMIEKDAGNYLQLRVILRRLRQNGLPLLEIASARRRRVAELVNGIVVFPSRPVSTIEEKVSTFLMHPLWGTAVLMLLLYFGFYRFVGEFGAGTLVEILENKLFTGILSPVLEEWANKLLPWEWARELLVMDYGIITLGIRYTITIIMPILTTFFLFFSFIEDSGYLPRAAYLINALMEKIGLTGKAVIPLTLGLGCGTLAVLVTRTLDSRRERLQTLLLLSVAVPCSAQLGLIMALLASGKGLVIWLVAVLCAFVLMSQLGRRLFGSEAGHFTLEIPPLRIPRPGAILIKTSARLRWYLKEIWLMFVGISVLMWVLTRSGLFAALSGAMEPVLSSMNLPPETAIVFIYGFLRRDYGAAGLYDLLRSGVLSDLQIVTAAVVLTLFVPCMAQLTVLLREQGIWFTVQVVLISAAAAWLAGMVVSLLGGIFLF